MDDLIVRGVGAVGGVGGVGWSWKSWSQGAQKQQSKVKVGGGGGMRLMTKTVHILTLLIYWFIA